MFIANACFIRRGMNMNSFMKGDSMNYSIALLYPTTLMMELTCLIQYGQQR